ncbi:MAG: hypothetical protein ABR970_10050 [Roseiarcus sp.]|jgi:hypothetical protein
MVRAYHGGTMRLAFVAGLAGLTASCSSLGSLDPANLISAGAATQAPATAVGAAQPADIDCPVIEVQDGTAYVRVGGQANDTVRYQFDITNTARECHVLGAQFAIKVGVAGHLLIGPAGQPGAYATQLRIVMRRDADQKPEFSKLYKIEADTAGASQAPFQFVSEPIMLPYTHPQADQDYTILVGFDAGHAPEAPKPHRKNKPTN